MKKFLMSVCAGVLMTASSFAGGGEGWLTNFEEAKKISAETGKPILADFSGSDWCGWCIKLDNEVFKKEAFKKYAKDNLVLLMVDYPSSTPQSAEIKKQNEGLATQYRIQGFPTVLILDKDGKVIKKTGYEAGGPTNYVKMIKKSIEVVDGDKTAVCPATGVCPKGSTQCKLKSAGAVKLCGSCGEIKGTANCCKKDAEKCSKCELIKGSPGCCKMTKGETIKLCSSCGEIKGTAKCSKKDAVKCTKCNLIKGSPACCKLPKK